MGFATSIYPVSVFEISAWELYLEFCRKTISMSEVQGASGSTQAALPPLQSMAPTINVTLDDSEDQVGPLPSYGLGRKFSLFGLFPQAIPRSSTAAGRLDNFAVTGTDGKDSDSADSNKHEDALTRSSSWSNFLKGSLSIDSSDLDETDIPQPYSKPTSPNVPRRRGSLIDSVQLLNIGVKQEGDSTQSQDNTSSMLRRKSSLDFIPLIQRPVAVQVTARQPAVPAKASFTMGDTDLSTCKPKEQSTRMAMPPPPPKPRRKKVRKQELNMFAPSSL